MHVIKTENEYLEISFRAIKALVIIKTQLLKLCHALITREIHVYCIFNHSGNSVPISIIRWAQSNFAIQETG
jgi:hypothetical protein